MLRKTADTAASAARAITVLTRAGIIQPYSPATLARLVKELRTWGLGIAGGFRAMAVRAPDQVAVIDELGELTWAELDKRSNALAGALRDLGVKEGESVAILVRNHRGFLDASLATAKLGADLLYLNTAFAAPQLGEVCEREEPAAIIYDEEFTELVDKAKVDVTRVLAWHDGGDTDLPVLERLIEQGSADPVAPPERHSRAVILTSGTTGTPKGAPRDEGSIDAAVSLLSRLHLKVGWRTHIAAPLFHTWGWAHLNLAMLLSSTVVLTRKFEPEQCLKTVRDHECDSLVVIPVMMQRILQLEESTLDEYDLRGTLKAVAASGSALPGDLGTTWMDRFGDTLFNIYGSTEVAWATIATPQDLREAPGTAGKAPAGTTVRLYGDDDQPVEEGGTGRIFVGNSMLFEGYTGGGSKDSIDGLMSSGDVGRFDDSGRLFVEGRDDEMIVSGGENVFPKEVEDCLSRHEKVEDVAAIGVDDEDYGKRLRAFVVTNGDVDEDTLKAHVKDNLARYKVPREIVFLDELPRNATGKILKRELADHDADGDSGDGSGADSDADSDDGSGDAAEESKAQA